MFRQIFIFYNQQEIFSHTLALALGREELKKVMEIVEPNMILPTPGQTLHRQISRFQIFHRSYGNTYFLIVVDLSDSFDYVNDILLEIVNKFKDLFPNPEDLKEPSSEKSEFIKSIYQAQKNLHSKIAIIGPTNSGKTTLYNLLKSGQERKIMDFAYAANYEIDNLNFDIWDVLQKDNFSLLWPKFLGGSDLIILVFDSKDYGPKLIQYFTNLKENHAKYSNLVIIANKSDLVSGEQFEEIRSIINISNIKELSLIDPKNALEKINLLIREALKLKRDLPSNFQILINEAEQLKAESNFSAAIAKYQELINICNEYQNFTNLELFQKKIDEITLKKEKKIGQQKIAANRKTFLPPEQIKFTQKVAVKSLPKTNSGIKPTPKITLQKPTSKPIEKVSPSIKAQIPSQPSKLKKLTLKPGDIKISLKSKIDKIQQIASFESKKVIKKVQQSDIVQKPKEIIQKIQPKKFIQKIRSKEPPKPTIIPSEIQQQKTDIISEKELDLKNQLRILIKNKGSDLSIDLCEFFINEMTEALGEPLTIEEIKLAADHFFKKESAIWEH